MVLHNDKWAKKAKRANERRKGVPSTRGRGREIAPNVTDRLDMNRPAADLDVPASLESDTDSSDDSFEFDSGDEGKNEQEKALAAAARLALAPTISTSQREDAAKTRAPVPEMKSTAAVSGHMVQQDHEHPKVDKRFARRKLLDNSSRYEEPVLDPYLQLDEPEPELDYSNLGSRAYINPNELELVPDEKTARKVPQIMEDTSHFEKLKHMQQKEEYARDMRRRFGQRAGYGRGDLTSSQTQEADDDEFFNDIIDATHARTAGDESDQRTEQKSLQLPRGGQNQGHEKLEQFLDDLLKI